MAVYFVQLDEKGALPIGMGEKITVLKNTEDGGMEIIFEDGV